MVDTDPPRQPGMDLREYEGTPAVSFVGQSLELQEASTGAMVQADKIHNEAGRAATQPTVSYVQSNQHMGINSSVENISRLHSTSTPNQWLEDATTSLDRHARCTAVNTGLDAYLVAHSDTMFPTSTAIPDPFAPYEAVTVGLTLPPYANPLVSDGSCPMQPEDSGWHGYLNGT